LRQGRRWGAGNPDRGNAGRAGDALPLGRTQTRPSRRLLVRKGGAGFTRDADGNLARLTWPTEPGDAYQAAWSWDALGRLSGVFEGADTSGLRLAEYRTDTASRPLSLVRPNGTRTDWTWRPGDLLLEVRHGFAGARGRRSPPSTTARARWPGAG
jgi:hypothetical protein